MDRNYYNYYYATRETSNAQSNDMNDDHFCPHRLYKLNLSSYLPQLLTNKQLKEK